MRGWKCAIGAVGMLLAAAGSAQEARKHEVVDTATISAIDPEQRILTVGDGDETRRLALDDHTRIRVGADTIAMSGLAVGDRVVISANREGAHASGLPVADAIQVVQRAADTPPVGAGPTDAGGEAAPAARAALRAADGRELGSVSFVGTPSGLLLRVSLQGLPAGSHGFHLHEVGRCDPPSFDSAGDHISSGRAHGFLNESGPHAGDLVNLVVSADGRSVETVRAPDLSIAELLDPDGAALVVHAEPDDYTSQPSGASGAPIACGVVERAGASRAE